MIISIRLEYNELTIMNIYHVIHVQVELSIIERNHNFNNNNIKKKLDSRFRGNDKERREWQRKSTRLLRHFVPRKDRYDSEIASSSGYTGILAKTDAIVRLLRRRKRDGVSSQRQFG